MSEHQAVGRQPSTDRVLRCVADETRRTALAVVAERAEPLPVGDLAAEVDDAIATGTAVDRSTDATGESQDATAVALAHVHLPVLVDAGLLEWDRESGLVSTTDHPALVDRRLRRLLAAEADDCDDVLLALADRRRRLALAVLESADGGLEPRALARRVVARESGTPPSAVTRGEIDDGAAALHHSHVPVLEASGLVAAGQEGLTYTGHTLLDREMLPEPLTFGEQRGDSRGDDSERDGESEERSRDGEAERSVEDDWAPAESVQPPIGDPDG